MVTSETHAPRRGYHPFHGTLRWAYRLAIALNFVRFALSFIPDFEGTADRAGIADKLFGAYTFSTFRVDFAWLIVSTPVIFLATFYISEISENDSQARLDELIGRAWTAAFVIYMLKSIFTGVLYPG
jgi:hypothetical protein